MNKEDREIFGAFIGLGMGAIGGLWFVSWLFHLGPEIEHGPWWAFAYYITVVAGGFVSWLGCAALVYLAVQRFHSSASPPQEK